MPKKDMDMDTKIAGYQGVSTENWNSKGSAGQKLASAAPLPTSGRYGTDQLKANKVITKKRGVYSDH